MLTKWRYVAKIKKSFVYLRGQRVGVLSKSESNGGGDVNTKTDFCNQVRLAMDKQHAPWIPRTISQHLDARTAEYVNDPFVLVGDDSYSYSEIQSWALRISCGLLSKGIKPGDHIAVVLANYPEFIAVKFAIAYVGAVCVPVNFLLRERELTYVLQQSDAVLLIIMDSFREMNYIEMLDTMMPNFELDAGGSLFPRLQQVVIFSPSGTKRNWTSLTDLESESTTELTREVNRVNELISADSYSDILYTSGTTGTPKGVLLRHEMVVKAGYASAYNRCLSPKHSMTYSLPMYHVFGYIECMIAVSFVGGIVAPLVAFDAIEMLRTVERHKIKEIVCVPIMTFALLEEVRRHKYDMSSVEIFYSSGGVAPPTIWDEIRESFNPRFLATGYGQTETTAATTATLPELDDCFLKSTNGCFRKGGAAGDSELDGALAVYKSVDLLTGKDLPRGELGELMVRGPIVTSGYYNKPEETADTFTVDGWLHTGDLGIVDENDYVILTGRVKETYRCNGEMVMPKEIENLLQEHPEVAQAHVVGIPDPKVGEVGCAFVVIAGDDKPRGSELIGMCSKNLARFKVPKYVIFVKADQLPLTVTGRVQKFQLAKMAQELLDNGRLVNND